LPTEYGHLDQLDNVAFIIKSGLVDELGYGRLRQDGAFEVGPEESV